MSECGVYLIQVLTLSKFRSDQWLWCRQHCRSRDIRILEIWIQSYL